MLPTYGVSLDNPVLLIDACASLTERNGKRKGGTIF